MNPDINFFNQLSYNCNVNSNYYLEDNFNQSISDMNIVKQGYFSFFHMNIRSLRANMNKMLAYIDSLDNKFDVLCLSETWLKENETDMYSISGYNHIAFPKLHAERGGVSLYIDHKYDLDIRHDLSFRDEYCECLFVELTNVKPVLIGIVYRSPGGDIEPFTESINRTLEKIATDKIACYFMGDVNIDLMRYSVHRKTSDFLDTMYANGFIPLINRPTRVTSQTATLIDHLYTNNLNVSNAMFQGILVTDITDHYPIFHMCRLFNFSCSNERDEYFYTRRMNVYNLKNFKMLISKMIGMM